MKSSKKLVVILSLIVVSSFLCGTVVSAVSEKNPFNQIWEAIFDLQSQVDEIEAISGTTRYVYDITIDLESDGDIIETSYSDFLERTNVLHWKRIEIPEIELDDLPEIQLYTPTFELNGEMVLGKDGNCYVDEGGILILYKEVQIPDGKPDEPITYYRNSEYTLVVIK